MQDGPFQFTEQCQFPRQATAFSSDGLPNVRSAPDGVRAGFRSNGSESQKTEFLRRILTGEDAGRQLFSESGSGFDLAGVLAAFDGEGWIVNGRKVWTTSARHAGWGLLLACTDWNAPKHAGQTYFVIDMGQPSVEAQPLKQMANGTHQEPSGASGAGPAANSSERRRMDARRAKAAQQQGQPQGPKGSIGKLAASHVARLAARVHVMIAGSDEIQRNIIAERVIGLPKEPRFDRGPFRDVAKAKSARSGDPDQGH